MSKRPFGEVGFSASSGIKLNANSSVVTDAFGDITTTPQGSAGQVLTSNGTSASPAYTNINVNASQISGVLPVANGGTASSTATGSGAVVLQNNPSLNNFQVTGLSSTTNATGVLSLQGSSQVVLTPTTGDGKVILSNSPTVTGNLTASGIYAVLISASSFFFTQIVSTTDDAVALFKNGASTSLWGSGMKGNGVYVVQNNFSGVMVDVVTIDQPGTLTALGLRPSNVTATTFASFDSTKKLITAPQSGTGSSLVTNNAPTINALALTGTTTSTGPITTSNTVSVIKSANLESSSTFQNGVTNWITGTSQGGAGTDFFWYNGGTRASLSTAGNLTLTSIQPTAVGANSVMYTNSSGFVVPVAGNLGTGPSGSVPGYALISNGPTIPPTWQPQAATSYQTAYTPTVQVFSTPGTYSYTPPAGLKYARITVVGGGGGGSDGNSGGGGGGGGAGGFYQVYALAAWMSASAIQVGYPGGSSLPSGSVSFNGTSTVTGVGTQFLNDFGRGLNNLFHVPAQGSHPQAVFTVSSVTSATLMTLTTSITYSAVGQAYGVRTQGTLVAGGITPRKNVGISESLTNRMQLGDIFAVANANLDVRQITKIVNTTTFDINAVPSTNWLNYNYFPYARAGWPSSVTLLNGATPYTVLASGGGPGYPVGGSGSGGIGSVTSGFPANFNLTTASSAIGGPGAYGTNYIPAIGGQSFNGSLGALSIGFLPSDTTGTLNTPVYTQPTAGCGGMGGSLIAPFNSTTGPDAMAFGHPGAIGLVVIEEFYN